MRRVTGYLRKCANDRLAGKEQLKDFDRPPAAVGTRKRAPKPTTPVQSATG